MTTIEQYITFFKDKKITLMGLGLLGRGIGDARFLAQQGAEVLVTDLKTKKELKTSVEQLKKCKNITFVLGKHREQDFESVDMVIKAAGVPLENKYIDAAKAAGVPIFMSAALFVKFAQEVGAVIVGVTGTRGKSTVTQMIYDAVSDVKKRSRVRESDIYSGEVYIGGNIRGMSTLELLPKIKAGDIVILELDSWQLQGFNDVGVSPQIAVFTNLYSDHMNYYKNNMDAYFADKAHIFKNQKLERGDTLIVSEQVIERVESAHPPVDPLESVVLPSEWKLQVSGEHNRQNAALAREALQALGLTDVQIKEGLENFKGVEGRLEYMGEKNGVAIYNDNNATSPEATMAALDALADRNIILILGGADKGSPTDELIKKIHKIQPKKILLLAGTGTDTIKELLPDSDEYTEFDIAIQKALALAEDGDAVLLSPAFSSKNMFANEYERGDRFKVLVKDFLL